jgi:hypothetical protein
MIVNCPDCHFQIYTEAMPQQVQDGEVFPCFICKQILRLVKHKGGLIAQRWLDAFNDCRRIV